MDHHEFSEMTIGNVCRVLENAAYLFVQPCYETANLPPPSWHPKGVMLAYGGQYSGTFRIWADETFCRYAAANMLGIDDGESEAVGKGYDALKELLNIIAGNFLTSAYGTQPVFDLGLPEEVGEQLFADDVQSNNAAWFEVEGRYLLLIIETGI